MKQMSRDPLAAVKARKAERRADEKAGGITIKPVSLPSADATTKPTGFKRGGFKNAFGSADDHDDDGEMDEKKKQATNLQPPKVEGWKVAGEPVEVESDGEWGDYDPRRPTGCWEGCPGRH